jgi:hypothetical protein
MRALLLLCVTGLLLPCAAQTASLPSVAVIDFAARGIPAHEAAIIADRVRGNLVKSGSVQVMERGQMEEVLKEQGFQSSGACSEASCVVEMGQLLAVSSIVSGSVGTIGGMYTLDLKLIDIRTGKIQISITEDVKGGIEDVLTSTVPAICDKLAKEMISAAVTVGFIDVTTEPQGATVILDDRDVGTTPLRGLQAQTGTHVVAVRLQGYAPQDRAVTVLKGKGEEVRFRLSLTSETLAERKQQKSTTRKKLGKVLRWVGAGVALAGAGAATAFWLSADATHDDYAASQDPDALPGLWDDTQTSATVGNVSAIVGAVGAVVLGVSFAF